MNSYAFINLKPFIFAFIDHWVYELTFLLIYKKRYESHII